MRDLKPWLVDYFIAIEQNVEIDSPGSILNGLDAAKQLLNVFQLVQEFHWRESRLDLQFLSVHILNPG